jgi:conjugative relaxase-like TrwC/TraI family protein
LQEVYYSSLATEDYYLDGGEPPGVWLGSGAEALGLSGKVDHEEFHHLFQGYSPDGTKALVKNAGTEGYIIIDKNGQECTVYRKPGWDFTFSAPKSVSVAWSVSEYHVRHSIEQAHTNAIQKAMSYVEGVASFTRTGEGGQKLEQAGLVIAAFEHGTSRKQDPQLHTHAVVLNVSTRAEGGTGALVSYPFYTHKMATGALYRAFLAEGLERIGFQIERDNSSFAIRGIPEALVEEQSKRRQDILSRLEELGLKSPKAAAIAAVDTREVIFLLSL